MSEAKKLCVITGASSGFGESIAKLFASRGYPMLLLARRLERMEALNLPNTMCRAVDVCDRAAVCAAVKEAEGKYGPVDCLVNNAGVMLLGKFDVQDPAEWEKMVDVNVKGVFNGTAAVLPGMKERKCGTIINISSVAGRKGFGNHAAYCGTKAAVHLYTETLREEVAMDNVRVIVLAPGAAETELLGHTTDKAIVDGYTQWKKDMGGVMCADDIAETVRWVYEAPQRLCIREVVLCATKQAP